MVDIARYNMKKKIIILVGSILVLFLLVRLNAGGVIDSSAIYEDPKIFSSAIEEKISAMTLEEKIGQMLLLGIPRESGVLELKELIAEGKIGSVILMGNNLGTSTASIREMISSLQGAVLNDIPLFISVDQEGGIVTRLKGDDYETTGQPDIETAGHARAIAVARANDLRELGINVNFSPVMEYITNKNSFLFDRVFRGDKQRVVDLGVTMVDGYQDNGVIATIKHFPGHANDSVDSHGNLPVVDISREDFNQHVSVFEDAIKRSNPGMVMMAHVLYPQIDSKNPSSISRTFVTDILRRNIDYTGVIITDDMNMGAITKKYGRAQAAVSALRAGNDILLYVGEKQHIIDVHAEIVKTVNSGIISETRINESVGRILKLKEKI
ncbi:hypothetical protein COB55_01100 [Candidatus Wolfebacteria bacterium]|nr:MAG: hypothetical protein COB55_01100 [Candidatus Wolfebacteria bacterium]